MAVDNITYKYNVIIMRSPGGFIFLRLQSIVLKQNDGSKLYSDI